MKTFSRSNITFVIAVGLFVRAASGQVGNDNPTGTSGQYNGNVTTGCSYDPYDGNATRSLTDLVVAGGVGAYPLAFTRTMNSRYTAGVPTPFGRAGNWNHSFGWSIDPAAVSSGRPASYTVNYPDGRRVMFRNHNTGDSKFRGPPGVRDRFKQLSSTNQSDCYLFLPDGGTVRFAATVSSTPSRHYTFSLVEISDAYSQKTAITYPADGSMTVTEPAGRTLKIFYKAGPAGDTVVDYVIGSDNRRVDYGYSIYATPNATKYSTLTSVSYFSTQPADYPAPNSRATATYTYQSDNIDLA